MNAARCPQCATAGTPDGGPGCSCRTGLRAEGQDFQPLRVRPYVDPDLSVDGVYDSQVRHYVALHQSHFGIGSDE